jgi:tetratricopeptide (TPR) repeat protein
MRRLHAVSHPRGCARAPVFNAATAVLILSAVLSLSLRAQESQQEPKAVDSTPSSRKVQASPPASTSKPEFFDQPQFTVSGVTDTTSAGGHGSDTIVHTRDAISKEVVSLSKAAPVASPGASEVEKSLRAEVQRDPGNVDLNHRLGELLVANGRALDAIPYLQHAAELKPGDYDNAYALALANERAGNSEHARGGVQLLLTHHDNAELHHLLGDVQESLGNSLDAVRQYERAAELDPSEANLFDWGSELLLHHAPEPALDVFTKANHLFPHSVRLLIGLGAAWFGHGSYGQAVQKICEASDLNPADPAPYLFLGRMQSAELMPAAEAVEKFHRFVTLKPDNAQANYYYAVGLWKLRQSTGDGAGDAASAEQVEALLKKATQLDPTFASAYLQLGILHSEQKDDARSISDYLQAIQADPQLAEAHYRLAMAYRQMGDRDKSAAEFQAYDQVAKESAQQAERERHEIRQFVYTLRDQPAPQTQ